MIKTALPALMVVLITLFSSTSFASNLSKSCDSKLDNLIESITKVGESVPFVPPEEAAYLEKEYKAWFQQEQNGGSTKNRYNLLAARPYFYAWQLHSAFDEALNAIQGLREMSTSAGIKQRFEFAATITGKFSNARNAWTEYAIYKDKELTGKIARDGGYETVQWGYKIGDYFKCLTDTLPD